MAFTNPRLRRISRVFHVGSLCVADKGMRGASFEGNGLSVSLHPQEWIRIAKLGGNPVHALSRPDGQFLDFHRLSKAQRAKLEDWGLRNGWTETASKWRVSWYDDETQSTRFMLLNTEHAARVEHEHLLECDDDARIETTVLSALTQKSWTRLGFTLDALSAIDMLATFYVEDETSYDGVWWNDKLDPSGYSAPRGVILKSRLARWSAAPLESSLHP